MTLTDNKVTLVSIRSVGQQTEQAFLDLVEKEESRGFARIYQADEAACREPHAARMTRERKHAGMDDMDAPPPRSPSTINRWLPYWAVFQADVRQTLRSWVYRVWVLAVAAGDGRLSALPLRR